MKLYEEFCPFGTSAYRAVDSSIAVSAKRYRYTGKERDEETGLDHMGARYYAPWLGRWTAADPIGIGDGVNRFAYVSGNPVGLRDPTGTFGEPGEEKPKAAKITVPVHEGDTREDVLERALTQEFGEKGLSATEAAVVAKDLSLLGKGKKRSDVAKEEGERTVKIPTEKYQQIADYVGARVGEEKERIYPGLAKRAHEKEDEALERGAKALNTVDTVLTVIGLAAVAGGLAKVLLKRAAARRAAREAGEKAGVEGAEQVGKEAGEQTAKKVAVPPLNEVEENTSRLVGNFEVYGKTGMEGDALVHEVEFLLGSQAKATRAQWEGLFNALEAEGAAAGASEVVIRGLKAQTDSIKKIGRLPASLGWEVTKTEGVTLTVTLRKAIGK